MLISVAAALRRVGVPHPLRRTAQLDELRVGEAAVEADTPIEIELVAEATGTSVVLTGTLQTVATCSCRRCLEPFPQSLVVAIREVFELRPTEGETYPLVSEHLDLVPLVRDAVLLSLPLAPLCRAECPGPAPELFPTQTTAAAEGPVAGMGPAVTAPAPAPVASESPRDPRWAALDQLNLDR